VNNYIQASPDSTGKRLQTFNNTIGGSDVHSQAITLVNSSGAELAFLSSAPVGSELAIVVRNLPSGTQAVSIGSLPLPSGAATETTLGTLLLNSTFTSRINTLGQKTMAASTPVVFASDQTGLSISGTVAATQSGTWTVQPGNTANTTPWLTTISQGGNSATVSGGALKVDNSAVTQPVSGTITANQGGTWTVQPGNTANTTAWKVDGSAVTQPVSRVVTDDVVGPVTFGALNDVIDTPISGSVGVGFHLSAGTLIGTIVPEVSIDGGSTWIGTSFHNLGNAIQAYWEFTVPGINLTAIVLIPSGCSHVRVRVGAYTSGSADCILRISNSSGVALTPVVITDGGSIAGISSFNELMVSMSTLPDATVVNGAGASAVNIQDGGNVITVDGNVVADAGAGPWPVTDDGGSLTVDGIVGISGTVNVSGALTDAQIRATPLPISGTVTANAGTNLNTSNLATSILQTNRNQKTQICDAVTDGTVKPASTGAAASDTALVVALSPNTPLPVGTNIIGALMANQSVNTAQINGITPLMGNGVTGTGSQRVTIASDNTAFTINAAQSGTWNVNNISGTISLPTGAATESTLGTLLLNSTFTGRINTLGQKTMANSTPVVLASDQASIPVAATQSGTWTVQPGNTANSTAWLVTGTGGSFPVTDSAGSLTVDAPVGTPLATRLSDGSAFLTTTSGRLSVDGSAVTQPTKETRSATGTTTSVASSASNVTILPSNANRLGATIFNDSTTILYLKLGATASTSNFTVKMQADGFYEVPFNYTGIIDGIWSSANGNARITELT
jgi:hypothetical protein